MKEFTAVKTVSHTRVSIHTKFFVYIFLLGCTCACNNTFKLYKAGKYVSGKLQPAQLTALQDYLKPRTQATLNDTLVINYNFNNDDCWQALQYKGADYFNKVVEQKAAYVRNLAAMRPGISVFQFRTPGKNPDPLILHTSTVITDSGLLRKMLFHQKTTCGSSAIVLPDGRYLIIRSDAHFDALAMRQKTMDSLLLIK